MNNELMLYVMDCKWAGMICVISDSEDNARELMKDHYNYLEDKAIKVYPLTNNTVVVNYGDL